MISAKEARAQTVAQVEALYQKELDRVEQEIAVAISEGKYSITRNGVLSPQCRAQCKALGYDVHVGSQYNDSYYTISW